ncbi:hypothetical protein QC763_0002620 [Podospora pseudopauciseta]|uniref:Amidase domain-containing protein n=1 Tax=Podospora pseudopauciseta TaxID=2093780 RepID=A0ABR0HWJ4_9PEZI|nr:hypothetical protein QC763_0002620 [Podospora pseudopauciseta]
MAAPDRKQSPPLDRHLERQIFTTVDNVQYFVHPQRLGRVGNASKLRDIIPVTGLTLEQYHDESCISTLERFVVADDVYTTGFGHRIVTIDHQDPTVDAKADADNKFPLHVVHGLILEDSEHPVRPGPYFLYNEGLHQAWRLYPDSLRAFNFGVFPKSLHQAENSPVTALSQDGLHKAIAVPSRLYYSDPSPEKPLAGMRFVVDDFFPVEGVKTTLSSESWTSFYPPSSKTCHLIRHLIGLGAIMVGKTKVSQFGILHSAWVDVSSPKNPRADGYQEALGSSPGAGSALAGYKWIDCAVGIDTLGGFMETAEWYGLFALRLSTSGVLLAETDMPSMRLSAIAFMSRSLKSVQQAAEASISRIETALTHKNSSTPPTNIVYLGHRFSKPNLELSLHLANLVDIPTEEFDMETSWATRSPPKAPSQDPLHTYMEDCAWKAYCHDFGQRYYESMDDYVYKNPSAETRDLFRLYWDDAVESVWREVDNLSNEDRENCYARMRDFAEWFDKSMESLQEPIVLLPTVAGQRPRSRVYSPSSYAPTAHRMTNWDDTLAAILERPQVILPVGRISFSSAISRATEALPLCISMMSRRNTDLELLDFVTNIMEGNKLQVEVEVGKDALPQAKETWQFFKASDSDGDEEVSSEKGGDKSPPPGELDGSESEGSPEDDEQLGIQMSLEEDH